MERLKVIKWHFINIIQVIIALGGCLLFFLGLYFTPIWFLKLLRWESGFFSLFICAMPWCVFIFWFDTGPVTRAWSWLDEQKPSNCVGKNESLGNTGEAKDSDNFCAGCGNENDVVGNDAIKQIAGKRIREVYFKQTQDGANQLVIVFTDFSGFSLQFGQSETKFLFENEINDIHKNLRDNQTICYEMFDRDGSENQRVKTLLDTLWSKSGIGDHKYNKEEWKALASILREAGYDRV